MKIKVTRVIEYIGTPEWIDSTLQHSMLKQENDQYGMPHGTITLVSERREETEGDSK